jgi:hypothetical protein
MILGAYLLFLVLLWIVYLAGRRLLAPGAAPLAGSTIRSLAATGAGALVIGALAILSTSSPSAYGVILLLVFASGGALYALGVVVWGGRLALTVRILGWAGIVVALLAPSVLTLALPLVALLAVTLRPVEGERRAAKTASLPSA